MSKGLTVLFNFLLIVLCSFATTALWGVPAAEQPAGFYVPLVATVFWNLVCGIYFVASFSDWLSHIRAPDYA